MLNQLELDPEWKLLLKDEFSKSYMLELNNFLLAEKKANKKIYPPEEDIFAAFNLTPFNKVKVVILGQDPYHGPGQGHGLCFSVKKGIPTPPSLQNIYKELCTDVNFKVPSHGNLESWANQGVLLLNAVLTVENGVAGSHQKKGWEKFTDKIIELLNEQKEHLVFILWGAYAWKKGAIINEKHHVIKSSHPSPLSAYRDFFNSKPFSRTNSYLKQNNLSQIDWQIH